MRLFSAQEQHEIKSSDLYTADECIPLSLWTGAVIRPDADPHTDQHLDAHPHPLSDQYPLPNIHLIPDVYPIPDIYPYADAILNANLFPLADRSILNACLERPCSY